MNDLSKLLTELSSPQDQATYEQYADGITHLVNSAIEQKNKVDLEISRFINQSDYANKPSEKPSEQQIIEQEELLQVRNYDSHENNVVGNVCIDLGGCYIPEYMRDPKCYKLFKTLYKSLKRKDGPQLINRVVKSCEQNPVLQNKLKTLWRKR